MNFQEYQAGVVRTWSFSTKEPVKLTDWQTQVLFCETGLSGETGELSEMIKKGIFHGLPDMLDKEKVKKELGDVLWYVTAMADTFGLTIKEIAEANNRKLLARYPDGFIPGGGIRTGDGA
jgi:NTP pyrophosphatase (non-canonical NTP hydrolase)